MMTKRKEEGVPIASALSAFSYLDSYRLHKFAFVYIHHKYLHFMCVSLTQLACKPKISWGYKRQMTQSKSEKKKTNQEKDRSLCGDLTRLLNGNSLI